MKMRLKACRVQAGMLIKDVAQLLNMIWFCGLMN